jgi:hypothetical protein
MTSSTSWARELSSTPWIAPSASSNGAWIDGPPEMLDEEICRPEWDASWAHTRGSVIQRVFSHDVWHTAEVNEALGNEGLRQIDLWD